MGILDVFKHKAKDLTDQAGGAATAVKDRAGNLAGPASDAMSGVKHKVSGGLESAGHFADARTNRKYTQHIDGAVDKAQGLLGGNAPRAGAGAAGAGAATGTGSGPVSGSDTSSTSADDPTDRLPRVHPETGTDDSQQ